MDSFLPPKYLRNPHLQSLLASARLRAPWIARRAGALVAAEKPVLLDCGHGVRLTGFFSPRPAGGAVAVLLHGWEGSARSRYLLSAAGKLYRDGFQVFRLQLRDHGGSHHLNRDLFHSCRLDEVLVAVKEIQRRFAPDGLYLTGFSLGGNFALRVAAKARAAGIDLRAVIAICPLLDPASTMTAMEQNGPGYERYFRRKWRRSLRRKARCFPDFYDSDEIDRLGSVRAMTAFLSHRYGGYRDANHYFDGYRITGTRLNALEVPAKILSARDDPIIPDASFADLDAPSSLTISRTHYGGHCGFIRRIDRESYADQMISAWFSEHGAATG